MQVKIIIENYAENIEKSVNDWLYDNPVKIISISYYSNTMKEYYHSDPNQIARQWTEYITTILYDTL